MPTADYVTVYHGTTDKYLPDIRHYGLIPGKGRGSDAWAAKRGWSVAKQSAERPRSVYVSTDASFASQFAHYVAQDEGGKPILLELHVPKERWSDFKPDEETYPDSRHLNWRRERAIPPTWIAGTKPATLTRDQELGMLLEELLRDAA